MTTRPSYGNLFCVLTRCVIVSFIRIIQLGFKPLTLKCALLWPVWVEFSFYGISDSFPWNIQVLIQNSWTKTFSENYTEFQGGILFSVIQQRTVNRSVQRWLPKTSSPSILNFIGIWTVIRLGLFTDGTSMFYFLE